MGNFVGGMGWGGGVELKKGKKGDQEGTIGG
jgi:hypothetical protein